jgi:hypothetical protein
MRRVLSVILVATFGILLLWGCGGPCGTSRLCMKNREAMPNLLSRMDPNEVVFFMKGTPYKTEYYKGKNGETIIVFNYLTNLTDSNSEVTDINLTPIFFVNSELVGWGSSYRETVLK